MRSDPKGIAASIAGIMLVSALPFALVGALGAYMQDDLHFSDARLGVIVGAHPFGLLVTALPVGKLIQRIGIRSGVHLCLATTTLSAVVAVVSMNWVMLAMSMFFCGCAGVLGDSVSARWVAFGVPSGRYGVTFGIKQSMAPAAAMIGGLVVPVIAASTGWRWAFVGAAVGATATAVVLRGAPSSDASRVADAPGPIRASSLVPLGICVAIAQLPVFFFIGFMVKAALDSGLSDTASGALFASSAGFGLVCRIVLGAFVDRSSRSPITITVVYLLIGSLSLVGVSTGNSLIILIACPLAFATLWGWQALGYVLALRTHHHAAAIASSILTLGFASGALVGSVTFGAIAEHSSRAAWLTAAVTPIIAATGLLLTRERLERPIVSSAPPDRLYSIGRAM